MTHGIFVMVSFVQSYPTLYMKCASHRGRCAERHNSHSDADNKINCRSDGAHHINTHRGVILLVSGKPDLLSVNHCPARAPNKHLATIVYVS